MKTVKESSSFFGHPVELQHPKKAFKGRTVPSPQSAFQTGASGMNTAITLNQKAPATTSDQMRKDGLDAYTYLASLTGLVSAQIRKEVNKTNDPELIFDKKLWQTALEHIPLWNYSELLQKSFNQHIAGTDLSVKFLNEIIDFSVDLGTKSSIDAVLGFSEFLKGLGAQISYGKTTNKKDYSVTNLSFGCRFNEEEGQVLLKPYIRAFFIVFKESDKRVYTTCSSHETYDYKFNYGLIEGEWQYYAIKNSEVLKNGINRLINRSEIDDIKNATNYFGCTVEASDNKTLK